MNAWCWLAKLFAGKQKRGESVLTSSEEVSAEQVVTSSFEVRRQSACVSDSLFLR